MKRIESATPEQWAEVERIRQWWIDHQTTPSEYEAVKEAVFRMWSSIGHPDPQVLLCDSPKACIDRATEDIKGTKRADHPRYVSFGWQAWAGWFEAAKVIGVEFDEQKYTLLHEWCKHAGTMCIPYDKVVYVSQRPDEVHWEDRQLHNEKGAAVRWSDGYSVWSIEGVLVNEQIVMSPETQTVEQINKEPNEEVRRIRIERFGWSRYVDECCEVQHVNRNEIEATVEILVKTPHIQRLLTHCPSTGRRYSLAIPGEEVKTCDEAQSRLWADKGFLVTGGT